MAELIRLIQMLRRQPNLIKSLKVQIMPEIIPENDLEVSVIQRAQKY